MDRYNKFILLLIILKVLFILLAMVNFYYRRNGQSNTKQDKQVLYWKSHIEFIFTILMACLLIYVFNPIHGKQVTVSNETKTLFFMFGFVLIITSKWELFIKTSKLFKDLQHVLK
jgi:hypothetical protein